MPYRLILKPQNRMRIFLYEYRIFYSPLMEESVQEKFFELSPSRGRNDTEFIEIGK
jgi:hypothetical protein